MSVSSLQATLLANTRWVVDAKVVDRQDVYSTVGGGFIGEIVDLIRHGPLAQRAHAGLSSQPMCLSVL
jgi:hypothetical protein